MTIEHITVDLDTLARQVDQIARQSLDPDSAERLQGIAQMLITEIRARERRLGEAWKLLGRCDAAFEMIATARLMDHRRRIIEKMRGEIKKASGG